MISAPVDEETLESRDLALALANRSAVLFSLKAYNLALDDIRLALESGYSKELRYKLLERKVINVVTAGIEPRVSPPKSGTVATRPSLCCRLLKTGLDTFHH